jgi:predicted TIM-barrel enzyme
MSSVASTASTLPFSNSNELVFDFATKEVIPLINDIPVVFGAGMMCFQTHFKLLGLLAGLVLGYISEQFAIVINKQLVK